MMIVNYETKKELTKNIGKPLEYTETSMFGSEYKSDGKFCGCNRPTINEILIRKDFRQTKYSSEKIFVRKDFRQSQYLMSYK